MLDVRWQIKNLNLFALLIFAFTFVNVSAVFAGPNRTTYQAKIVKPDGYPLEAASVNFKFTILDPAGSCILYAETYSAVNMSATGGLISFALGSGVKTYPASATTFEQVFSNITPALSCDAGGPPSYSPLVSDSRKIVMQFHDGNGWQTLPAMSINAVPYAMYANEALKLNGKTDAAFVEVVNIPSCLSTEALRYNGTSFSCIDTANVSGAAVVAALGFTPAPDTTVSAVSSTVFSVSSTVSTLASSVSTLQSTVAASFAALTSSQWLSSGTTISYNSGNVGIGTTTPVTKLEVSGGVRISMEAAICAVSYAGTLRYNTGLVEYCNAASWVAFGVAGAGITLLNGSASGTQTFVTGISGTNYNITSNNGVHSFNIPLAASSSVTAGLLSNADYTIFTNKMNATSAAVISALGYTPAVSGAVLDLGSAQASGTLAAARLPAFSGDATSTIGTSVLTLATVGSGVTSGTQYTKVTVDGKGRVTSGAQLSVSDVTTALGYTPATASASTQWNTSGSAIFYNSGNVGIGVSVPTSKLDIAGSINVNGGNITTNSWMQAGNMTAATYRDSGTFNYLGFPGSNSLALTTAGSERLRITSMGAVGINTTTPVATLDVSGGVRISMESATCAVSYAGTLRYNAGLVEYCNGSAWSAFGVASSGLTSLNGSTSQTQTFANGTTGTQPAYVTVNGVHTLNIPLASAGSVTGGLLSNADYVTFMNKVSATSASVITALGYTPANNSASGTYAQKANNLSDLASATAARTNLGLGYIATLTSVDLGSADVSGTLAIVRTPAYSGDVTKAAASNTLILSNSGVTAGTYNKVTVDAKGRVTSSSALSVSDVTTALGYTPASATASTQWTTSGSAIFYNSGNVGIGSTSPRHELQVGTNNSGVDVKASVVAGVDKNSSLKLVESNATLESGFQIQYNGLTQKLNILSTGSGTSTFSNDSDFSTTALSIDRATSNIGIGTLSPVTKLEVSGGVRISMEAATCTASYAGTLRYTGGNIEYCNGSSWTAFGVATVGVNIINGSTSQTQTFANGTTGTAPVFATANGVHTLNIPLASAGSVTSGLLSNADYTTFMGKITSSAASISQVLGYAPVSTTTLGNYVLKANNLSDLTSSATARTNLGLGTFATASSIDLGSASATGTMAAARMPELQGDVDSVSGSITTTVVGLQGRSVASTAPASGQVLAYNGTSWAPATSISSQWSTSGSTINYSSGNVGIGTTNPTRKLHIHENSGAPSYLQITASSTGVGSMDGFQLAIDGSTSDAGVIQRENSLLYFSTNNIPRLNVTGDGNVGIGTSAPAARLEVAGTAALSTAVDVGINLSLKNTAIGNTWNLYNLPSSDGQSPNGLLFENCNGGCTRKMTLTAAGNVGIGTANPGALFDVAGNVRMSGSGPELEMNAGGPRLRVPAGNTLAIHTGGGFGATANERMRIDAVGNVGIGTTSPENVLSLGSLGLSGGFYGLQIGKTSTSTGMRFGEDSSNYSELTWNDIGNYLNFSTKSLGIAYSSSLVLKNGNVGIGTTSPNSTLEVSGTLTATKISGVIASIDNRAVVDNPETFNTAGMSLNFKNNSTNSLADGGLYNGVFTIRPYGNAADWSGGPAHQLGFTTNGNIYHRYGSNTTWNTWRRIIETDNAGNVGIGTTSPTTPLHVVSAGVTGWNSIIKVETTAANAHPLIMYRHGGADTGYVGFGDGAGTNGFGVYNYLNADLTLGTSSTTMMTFKPSGNVGIGTTSPSYRFQVNKISSAPAMMIGGAYAGSPRLQVYGLDADSNAWMGLGTDMGGSIYEHSIYFPTGPSNNGRLTLGDYNGATYNTRMTVLQNGNVGIGTTAPITTLHVAGTGYVRDSGNSYVEILSRNDSAFNVTNNSATKRGFSLHHENSSGLMAQWYHCPSGVCTQKLSFDYAGNMVIAGTLTQSSDIRLKKDIVPLQSSLDKILSLNGVFYYWKDKEVPGKQIGLIAQEVEKVFPEIIRKDEKGFLSVGYQNLVAPLIESVKELYRRLVGVEQQQRQMASIVETKADKSEVEQLKTENAALKAYICGKDPSAPLCK